MGQASLSGYLAIVSLLGFGLRESRRLLQHKDMKALGNLEILELDCNGNGQAFIEGGRGVGIPIIMGLALSSRKIP